MGASPTQESFLLGNKLYQKGDPEQALQVYKTIKKRGAAVWYNMGNCYYHAGDFVEAIICWQHALRVSSSLYQNVQTNCAVAYQKLNKKEQNSFLNGLVEPISYKVPMGLSQIILLFFWFVLVFVGLRLRKSAMINVIFFGLLMSTIVWGMIVFHQYQRCRQNNGIVHKTTPIYVGPNNQYHIAGSLEHGDMVELIEQRDDWYKLAKGNIYGWVPSTAIAVIGCVP